MYVVRSGNGWEFTDLFYRLRKVNPETAAVIEKLAKNGLLLPYKAEYNPTLEPYWDGHVYLFVDDQKGAPSIFNRLINEDAARMHVPSILREPSNLARLTAGGLAEHEEEIKKEQRERAKHPYQFDRRSDPLYAEVDLDAVASWSKLSGNPDPARSRAIFVAKCAPACHDGTGSSRALSFSQLRSFVGEANGYRTAHAAVESSVMPPRHAPALSDQERADLFAFLDAETHVKERTLLAQTLKSGRLNGQGQHELEVLVIKGVVENPKKTFLRAFVSNKSLSLAEREAVLTLLPAYFDERLERQADVERERENEKEAVRFLSPLADSRQLTDEERSELAALLDVYRRDQEHVCPPV